jgi:hypothetical protein
MNVTWAPKAWRFGAIGLFSATCMLLAVPASSHAAGGPVRTASLLRSAAQPFGMNPQTYQLMIAQMPLDAAANKVQVAAARPGAGHDGFLETQVNPRLHTVTVVWHGVLPTDIQRLIASLRARVTIRIVRARYSLARLNQALRQALRDPEVVMGYPENSGGGVHLDLRGSGPWAEAALHTGLGVPVSISVGVADHPQSSCLEAPGDTAGPGSRCYDLPAFWGGDVINDADYSGTYCTGGFGVHNSAGQTFMMTAAHCAWTPWGSQNGVWFMNGNATATLGQITDVPGNHDGAIIPTSSGDQYYDGPGIAYGDTYRTKTVAGQQATSIGDTLCVSGAVGGTLCPMKVTELNCWVSTSESTTGKFTNLALAVSEDYSTGGTEPIYPVIGDSGAPWFSLDGSHEVWAKGIHHGIMTNKTGIIGALFTPITVLSSDMGVWVNTP